MTFSAQICSKMDVGLETEKIDVGIRISILAILCVSIFRQNRQLWLFLAQIRSKTDSRLEIQKTNVNKNHHPGDTMNANFQAKPTTLTFLTQIFTKIDLMLETHNINVGVRMIIFEILCVPIFRQNEQLWYFWPKIAQKWI